MQHFKRSILLGLMLVLACGGNLRALINPNFTPVDLVEACSEIVEVKFGSVKDGSVTADVVNVMKGKLSAKSIVFNLKAGAVKEQVKDLAKTINEVKNCQGILFVGSAGEEEEGGFDDDADADLPALLHVEGNWISFIQDKDAWNMTKENSDMGTTWAGGTDMLIRAAAYILSDEEADVPVKEGAGWGKVQQFDNLGENVKSAQAVDLSGSGKLILHVASTDGDRLYQFDAEKESMVGITNARKLAARSLVASWVDCNADGKMDLLSWDGKVLRLHLQTADGTFAAGQERLAGQLRTGCLSLSPIGKTAAGVRIVIGTNQAPLIWTLAAKDKLKPVGEVFKGAALGRAGLCLVADFNGDALPDILQIYRKGSLVYPGSAMGTFKDSKPIAIKANDDSFSAFTGDFDADGLLDVFTVSPNQKSGLWSNRGAFSFKDTMRMTGELAYKGYQYAVGGAACDFDCDGRQDVAFFYDMDAPRLYFSRGFRSFGLANGMDISEHNIIENATGGVKAGCMGDFNGDGCQDMVAMLAEGDAYFLPVTTGDETVGGVRAELPSDGKYTGPLTVTGWQDKRCLGAWSVIPGTQEAFFGMVDGGSVLLKWTLPNGKEKQKTVEVDEKPVRVVLD